MRSTLRTFGVVGGAAVLLLGLAVLLRPWPAPAQQPAAPAAAAALPEGYAGAETCKTCHEDQFVKFEKTRMGRLFLKHPRTQQERLACETCHGPGKAHAEAGGGKGVGGMVTFAKNDKTPVDKRNATCLSCHTKGARLYWQGSAHESRDVACTNCHKVMEETSAKSQLAKVNEIETCGQCHVQKKAQAMGRSSHMPLREGKMTCTSCHNPHGTVTQTLLKENGVNETCYTCHTEKRGPFLHTHPPVQENCLNCHEPHGSNHEKMLKVAKPRLCHECHQGGAHGNFPMGKGDLSSLRFEMGRQCVQCHANIHGSNHPAGRFFTR
jgi:DmsE family decaheme c-type cytochrome